MDAGSAKQMALEAVKRLPDDATLEDAMERIYFLQKIERGLADVAAGRVVPHQEVVRRFEERFARRERGEG
jgi:predicted transcriptional regulator